MESISTLGWVGIGILGLVVVFLIYRFRENIFKSILPFLIRTIVTLLIMALLYGLITLLS